MPLPSLYLIDGSSYIYRAFHAIPRLSNSKGMPTNAVYGFTTMLLKVVNDRHPEYLAIAFDPKGATQRHGTYEAYKANRPAMPEMLQAQIPWIHKVVEAFRIPVLLKEGEEADDLIGTVAGRAVAAGYEVTIVTGDKDMLQLIGERVRVMDTMKDKVYREAEVFERFGVRPDQVPEIMGLMGDAIDNIPGVKGIGEKTAMDLIQRFGTVDQLLSRIDEISKPKLRQLLREQSDQARMSRELATIRMDIPFDVDFSRCRMESPDREALVPLFREMEFASLLKQIGVAPTEENHNYREVTTDEDLARLVGKIRQTGEMGLVLRAPTDAMTDDPIEVALSPAPDDAFYLTPALMSGGMPAAVISLLTDGQIKKYCFDVKLHILLLQHAGIHPEGMQDDPMIASYLLNPGRSDHRMAGVALEYLHLDMEEGAGRGGRKGQAGAPDDGPSVSQVLCRRADVTLKLMHILRERLQKDPLEKLYRDVEIPLSRVLARMEMNGIRVNGEHLKGLSKEIERELGASEGRIYRMAGGEFNINSPKQLQGILFERLGLRPVKKTKTGYSTDESVLMQLALSHELPAEILNYRQFAKLKSTYVDALIALIDPKTGRVHTSFNQTVAATGRLSSSDPNLQNIPIRTEMGQRIREAFVAEEGCLFLAADYSQVELRVLAHLSGDASLIASFQRDEDIHTRTASQIFNLAPEQVTAEMRRRAKAVNFGILYGMSPFGLASDIGISQQEAKGMIDHYFTSYPGVRAFIDQTLREAREKGYVTTLFGRRRAVPELASPDKNTVQFGERIAVNTPIQGTAADLIKVAMIHVAERLDARRLKARMILQVHDELLLEVPQEEMAEVQGLVKDAMEGVISLAVPIRIEMGIGRNWREAG